MNANIYANKTRLVPVPTNTHPIHKPINPYTKEKYRMYNYYYYSGGFKIK